MTTSLPVNLAEAIKRQLPTELNRLVQTAGEVAQGQELNLYLVGGVVRDLMLRRQNYDIDLVVEGDAITVASRLAERTQSKLTTYPQFGTASLQKESWRLDLATARSETYERPGALPTVKPGTIRDDLFRRDFTINAMAVELNPSRYGQLLDLYKGREDIEQKLIRVLHNKSFTDDATRIWRAVRYEQRLDFQIEPATLFLLKHDLDYLDEISGDRIRHELELVLKEAKPEKALRRAGVLGMLAKLHPALKADDWLAERYERTRQYEAPEPPSNELYMALLTYRMTGTTAEELFCYLHVTRSLAEIICNTLDAKEEIGMMVSRRFTRSCIYALLCDYSPVALEANIIATDSSTIRRKIELFLNELCTVKTTLNGTDLKKLGIAPGPNMRKLLNKLLEARLEGKVKSCKDEDVLVKTWIGDNNKNPNI